MTIKFIKIFFLSTLLSYTLLTSLASNNGYKQYQTIKANYTYEKYVNNKIKNEIDELKNYKIKLENGEFVNDLLFELGYVNNEDKVYVFSSNENSEIYQNSIVNIKNDINQNEVISLKTKKYQFIILSTLIGIAISICYLLLSKKMEKYRK